MFKDSEDRKHKCNKLKIVTKMLDSNSTRLLIILSTSPNSSISAILQWNRKTQLYILIRSMHLIKEIKSE